MGLFPSYDNIHDESSFDQSVNTSLFKTIEYKIETIVDKINDVDNLKDEELKNIIIRQYSLILNYDLFLSSAKTRKIAQKLFTNKRFLILFFQIIGLLNLNTEQIYCVNKLAYDYYILPIKDPEISELLLNICNSINNMEVIRLSSRLGINNARILSMISKSTFQIEKRIHRINMFFMKCEANLTAQDVIDIMCILYDKFTYPIIYTMLETKAENLNELQAYRFDLISSSIITILSSMTSDNIRKVLYDYAFTLRLSKPNSAVRFSMKSIPDQRIQSIIQEIESDLIDKLFIP